MADLQLVLCWRISLMSVRSTDCHAYPTRNGGHFACSEELPTKIQHTPVVQRG